MPVSPLVIRSLRGGRNGYDPPTEIPDDQCLEAVNVDWWGGTLACKRGGSTALSTTFSSGGPFSGIIGSLVRHVPAGDESAAELWAFDSAGVNGRLAGATTWTAPTFTDAVSDSKGIVGVSLDGFLHLYYDSTQNRSHVWDSALNKVRRSGLATPSAPTAAQDGAGGLSFTRYYRQRYVDVSGSVVRRLSEASSSVSITISSKAGVTVTKSASISEDETHWDLEAASSSSGPWYRIARTAVGTTTYDDTSSSIDATNPSALAGAQTPPPSAKFAVREGGHILMMGCYETSGGYTTARNNAAWFTAALGSSDQGDAERVPTANRIGLEDVPTGCGGPLFGSIWGFAYRRIWKFVPTGVPNQPYQKFDIRTDLGALRHQAICMGEDEFGNAALYFLSARGPYRITQRGIQYLGMEIEDLWETVNLAATNTVCHAVYYQAKHQVWFHVATSAANDPNLVLVFDCKEGRTDEGGTVRRGWAKHTGISARCSVLFSNTVAAAMSPDLKPYVGITTNNTIWKRDSSATDDAGTNFQAYVDTKEYGDVGRVHAISGGSLIGEAATGVTITVTPISDFGLETGSSPGTALLTASGSETRVQKRLEGMQTAGVGTYRLRIGDASAVSNAWNLDVLMTNETDQGSRAA